MILPPPPRKRRIRASIWVFAGLAVLSLGFLSAREITARWRENAEFHRHQRALLASLEFTALGQEFQDFALIDLASGEPVFLSDVLASGGLLLFQPADYPYRALNLGVLADVLRERGPSPARVIIVTAGDGLDSFLAALEHRGIELPVYHDYTDALRGAIATPNEPVYFMLDNDFRLTGAGYLGASYRAYERALE